MGRFRTQSLFYESRHTKYPAPFTLKDEDHEGRVSMYKEFMRISDPTEYKVATELLGSWRHWEVLTACEWFKPYVERWRKELSVSIESKQVDTMKEIQRTMPGTPQAIQATKWLAYRNTRAKPKRGRPSKMERQALLKEESTEDRLLQEEAERLGLN